MATKARQIYTADEQTLHKDKRTLEIESGYKTKIDGIEAGAEVNTIETIKVNGTEIEPDDNRVVDLTIPNVIDNVSSVSSTDALSANMGRALAEEIQNLKAQGRFLSFWNAAAGRPTSEPPQELYTYHTGDYFIVNQVAVSGGTNYRPDGTTYTIGQVSSTVETEAVVVGSEYVFDGTIWLMLAGGGGGGSIIVDQNLSTTSHNPVWNATITNALNTKEVLTNKVTSLSNPSNTTYPTTQAVATELATKQDTLTAGENVQINNNVISATDTTYTAGTGITITNNVIRTIDTGDMRYEHFEFDNKIGASIQLSLSSEITPITDFTVNVPTEIKEGQVYILRVNNGDIAYNMTLGQNITNPHNVDLSLDAGYTDQFVFLATSSNILELQPELIQPGDIPEAPVTDVKVDGTSVVDANKVANIYSDEAATFSSTYGMTHRTEATKGDIAKVQNTELKSFEGQGIIDIDGAVEGGMTGLTVHGYFDEVSPLPTGYTQVNKVNGNTTLSTGLSGDLATVTIDGDKGPFKLRANGQLVFNAVPCINDSSVVGFYDLVSKTFKQPAATVTAGTEVTGPTPEVPRVIISNNGPLRYDTQEQEWYTEGPDTVIQISYIG